MSIKVASIMRQAKHKPKILVFASMLPLPIDRGDKNRLYHVLSLLRRFAQVRLACLKREWEPSVDSLESLADIQLATFPVTKAAVIKAGLRAMFSNRPYQAFRYDISGVRDFVKGEAATFKPDVFWGFQISSYPFLKLAGDIRLVLDLVDSPSRNAQLTMEAKDVPLSTKFLTLANRRITAYEARAMRESDIVLISSQHDKQYLTQTHGFGEKTILLPNCVPASFLTKKWNIAEMEKQRLLFVGNLAYPPNLTAITKFALKIFPMIRNQLPDLELMICGKGGGLLSRAIRKAPGIRVAGFVNDLEKMYLQASALVAPLSIVTGTQNKVLEAMALGLPVISSPQVAAAAGLRHGREILVAENAEEYLDAFTSLLNNTGLATKLSACSREFMMKNYTWERQINILKSLFDC